MKKSVCTKKSETFIVRNTTNIIHFKFSNKCKNFISNTLISNAPKVILSINFIKTIFLSPIEIEY